MHRSTLQHLVIALLVFFCPGFACAGFAQQKPPLHELFLPGHKVHVIPHQKQNTWVMLSERSIEHHIRHYLSLCQGSRTVKASWRLTSPSSATAHAWLAALHQTPNAETANFMLNLHHIQTGVNVSLTIGELKPTSAPPFRSIITLDTPHERKGGK